MSNKKLNLPAETTVSLGLPKVEVAKLQVYKEAMVTVQAICGVLKSHKELQSTCVEWEGRIRVAESDVQKAEANLQATREQNKSKMEELEQSREALMRLLSLFDDVMEKAKAPDLPDYDKKALRQYLLQLADKIVQLKK